MSFWRLPATHLALALGLLLLLPSRALACSLDGVASLSVDGRPASASSGAAGNGPADWAPFTLDAAASGALLHFAEDLPKVRRSLPVWAFAAPFRWTFGDGATATERTATHRYVRPGRYLVTVGYYWPSRHRWVEFDRAAEPILPAGTLWRQPVRPVSMGPRLIPLALLAGLAGGLLPWTWLQLRRRGGRPAPRSQSAPAGELPGTRHMGTSGPGSRRF